MANSKQSEAQRYLEALEWIDEELRACRHDNKSATAALLSIQIIIDEVIPK